MEATLTDNRIGVGPAGINDDYEILDTKHGLMLCNRHDIGMTAALESEECWAWPEIESLKEFYKGVVIDVGANVGTHTLVYSRYAEHVYAIEPQLHIYNNLCANLLLNGVTNVTTVKCALSNIIGTMTMKGFDPSKTNCPAGASLGVGEEKVPVRSLDSLDIPHVDFLKMDIEGHEWRALIGAKLTLERSHPVVYVEIHSRELTAKIKAFMEDLGYNCIPWCHTDILSAHDYPDRIQFTEGYVFTCQEHL